MIKINDYLYIFVLFDLKLLYELPNSSDLILHNNKYLYNITLIQYLRSFIANSAIAQ